jgi:4-hydroxybenzoate polyprenyltransferase
MLPGIVVAIFYRPEHFTQETLLAVTLTIAATCLVASSNYVLNEILDARTDLFHPYKSSRSAASGHIRKRWAIVEWGVLGAIGFTLAMLVNPQVGLTALTLWVMGLVYNVPPLRLKDWAYLDVLTESANNALRLGLGWFAILPDRYPPFSLVLAYWMAGAFLMASKRLSEYRELHARGLAGLYRRSFDAYTELTLLASSVFYATLGAYFGGMFIVRYRLELVLMAPLVAGLFAYYIHMAYQPQSAAQHPERLYKERILSAYLLLCLLVFTLLMFVRLAWLYDWFTIDPAGISPLWHIG